MSSASARSMSASICQKPVTRGFAISKIETPLQLLNFLPKRLRCSTDWPSLRWIIRRWSRRSAGIAPPEIRHAWELIPILGQRSQDRVQDDQLAGRNGRYGAIVAPGLKKRRCLIPVDGFYEWKCLVGRSPYSSRWQTILRLYLAVSGRGWSLERGYIFPRHSQITIGIASRMHPRYITRKGQSPSMTS
jgi:SOS response associated peptidase (SRAP)